MTQLPNVKNTATDQQTGVTYNIMAYRTLTREEIVLAIRHALSQQKKPKRGTTLTIITTIGLV